MFAQRVRPDELIDLLAAESYDPVLMEYCSHTLKSPKLEAFLYDKARLGVTGTIANAYVPAGTDAAVPYLTTKQVGGLYAHLDGCKYITAEADKAWAKCRVPDGAIVLNKSGNVGAAAIVACAPYSYVNTVSDLINIRPRRPGVDGKGRAIDSGYLVVFLNSPFGQSQLQRLSGGAVFDHVSLYAVPEIRIFEPAAQAQRYIGDKVRLAERLRERARELRLETTAAFEAAGLSGVAGRARAVGRVSAADVVDRLDALHYRADLLENLRAFRRHTTVRLGSASDFAGLADGDHGNPRYGDGPIYVRATELSGGTLDAQTEARLDPQYASGLPTSVWATSDDVMFSIVGTLGATGILEDGVRAVLSRGVAKVRPLSVSKHYVKAFMRTNAFSLELLRRSVGTIQRGVYLESLQFLEIPVIDRAESIAENERKADLCMFSAKNLTKAAGVLVERLIEGQVPEADLVAAQKALESSDRGLDRAILQSLRQNANPAQPLIADLDALYTLLDELKDTP